MDAHQLARGDCPPCAEAVLFGQSVASRGIQRVAER